ncbi:MAG: hypothetical protein JST16_17390 [Bdellovibrionales bacterium]|nr:hypothetical protein [Bdellovibrionales bacterium]
MERTVTNRRAFTITALVGGALTLPLSGNAQTAGKTLSKKQLAELVATAKTAADHRKLAEHYRAAAAKHEAEAKEHVELAAKYRANPTASETKRPGAPDTASHCMTFAEHCRKQAAIMNEMAAMHEEMAKKMK